MKLTKTTITSAGLLFCGLALPGVSYGITGCTNGYVTGTYNAQISSANFMSVLNSLNATAGANNGGSGSTGSTGGTGGSGSGGSTGSSGSGSGSGSGGGGTANAAPFGGSTGFGNGYAFGTPGFSSPAAAGTTGGTTGSTGSTSGGTTGAVNGGLGNNPSSFGGAVPGLGRFFFDGNGNIVGQGSNGSGNVLLGTYTVNIDCTATMKFTTGQTFNAVVAQSGARILFIESDANGAGAIGELDRATTACAASQFPQSFAFSFFGAQPSTTSSSGGSGSSGSGGSTGASTTTFSASSGIGSISLDASGNFSMTEWILANGAIKPVQSSGTYTLGMDCNIRLSFAASSVGGAPGSVGGPPALLSGLLVGGSTGLVIVQTDQNMNDIVPGQFIAQ